MNLVIVIYSLASGGAERVTTNLANHWAENGWDITIVTIAGRNLDFYDLSPKINRISLELAKESSGFFSSIVNNYRRVSSLRAVLKKKQPDVALAIMTTSSILLSFAARGLNFPSIGSERAHPPMLPLGKVWWWLRKRTYRHLSAVAVLTEDSMAWLQSNVRVQRAVLIPNPVNYPLRQHDPVVPLDLLDKRRFTLLAVGRLSEEKGFDRLLQAYSVLASHFPDWQLVVVGEGSLRPSLEALCDDLGLQGRVFFPGAVGNIADWYTAADLFVMTSLYEGFPNVLIEAMAYGLPVVSVDCDTGPRDIVRDGTDGLLVPQNDHHQLVESLETLMSNEGLRKKFSNRAIDVRERFSIERISRLWESLFMSLRQ